MLPMNEERSKLIKASLEVTAIIDPDHTLNTNNLYFMTNDQLKAYINLYNSKILDCKEFNKVQLN